MLRSNFKAWLTEGGLYVPGSLRKGHNVITNSGREWLTQLVGWSTIGISTDDIPFDTRRFRWLGVGGGSLLELKSVDGLDTPLTITTGPDEYIREIGPLTHVTDFAARYVTTFTGASADFDHQGATVDISEAAIFVDVDSGGGPVLDTSLANNVPAAYKSFSTLTKAQAQDLVITWEFRF